MPIALRSVIVSAKKALCLPARLAIAVSLYASSLTLSICACKSPAQKNENSGPPAISAIVLPQPPPLPKKEMERLKTACTMWYDSSLKQNHFNGGMLVAKDGQVVFEQYAGTGHLPGNDTINKNTPLHIASTSKTFTAMAVLLLYQEGKLKLDDEFSKYFPEFNYPGVTVRCLLDHRSGLPNYIYFMESLGWDQRKMVTNPDVLNYLVTRKAELTNIAPPDLHFSYCNTNYALLALLVEKISGEKFPAFLNRVFFAPLQMKNSFVYQDADNNRIKPSYDWRGRLMTMTFLDQVYGDKNVYTTPRDLLIWDRALSGNLLFTKETLEAAYTPYSNEKPGIKNYGLGWRMDIYPDGRRIIFHNGWWHGSNSTFVRLLKDSASIIVIGNRFTRAIYHAKALAGIFGEYFVAETDDETDNVKVPDSLQPMLPIANSPEHNKVVQKESGYKVNSPAKPPKRKIKE